MTKKNILIALKVAISGGLIWFLLSNVDLGAAKDRVLAADFIILGAAASVMLIQIGVAGVRWWVVMRAIEAPLPWLELCRLFWIGGFFSQALPSSVGGDPVRIYLTYKDGCPLGKAINGVMLERVITIVGLVVLVAAVQPIFLPKLNANGQMLTQLALLTVAAAAIGGITFIMFLDRLPESLSRFKIVRGASVLAGDTRKLFLRPINAILAVITGVATHVVIALCVYLIGRSLDVEVTWLDCMVLMPPVILATTIPISIAGWGVREGAMVTAFALVGVPSDAALVMSLTLGLLAIAMMIPGGVFWLLRRNNGEQVSVSEAAEIVETEMAEADQNAQKGP